MGAWLPNTHVRTKSKDKHMTNKRTDGALKIASIWERVPLARSRQMKKHPLSYHILHFCKPQEPRISLFNKDYIFKNSICRWVLLHKIKTAMVPRSLTLTYIGQRKVKVLKLQENYKSLIYSLLWLATPLYLFYFHLIKDRSDRMSP